MESKKVSELKLLQKLKKGDKAAFLSFYKKTKPKLLNLISQKVKSIDDAEEILQDSYLAFLDSLPLFLGQSSLWTFLVSISRHETADYWRKKYAKKAILTLPYFDQVYTEKLYSSAVLSGEIEKVFAQMPPIQVEVLKLKYQEQLKVKEIAQFLQLSLKATESLLFRARQSFQAYYGAV